MTISPLKLGFAVSVLIHGIVLGGVAWYSRMPRPADLEAPGGVTTIELIAAPAAVAPEATSIATLPEPITPAPAPAAPVEPAPVIPAPSIPAEDVIPVAPQRVESSVAPQAAPVPPVAVVAAEWNPPQQGDGSSRVTGMDTRTQPGAPQVTATPRFQKNREPDYPPAARRRGQQGLVLLSVTVNTAGRAATVTIKTSSGFELLDQAALAAVAQYEFEPARLGGQAVESRIEVPIRFKLNR